jgi:hypothetical protein
MKRVVATVVIECEDDVTTRTVRDMVANVLWLAFEETAGGRCYWRQAVVSAREEAPRSGELRRVDAPADPLPVTRWEKNVGTLAKEFRDGCLSRVRPDEPIFVLRAQDVFAPEVVECWADHVEGAAGEDAPKVVEARKLAAQMREWQRQNAAKVPD